MYMINLICFQEISLDLIVEMSSIKLKVMKENQIRFILHYYIEIIYKVETIDFEKDNQHLTRK